MLMTAKVETENPLTPDNSEVNRLDIAAAQFFYNQCQELGVQLIIVPHEVRLLLVTPSRPLFDVVLVQAAVAVPISSNFYDGLAAGGSFSGNLVREVRAAQHTVLKRLFALLTARFRTWR